MQDVGLRRSFEAFDDLEYGIDGRGGRQRTAAVEPLGERGPHRLKRNHRVTIDLGGAEDEDAVWMTDRSREAPFAQEPLALPRAFERPADHLERNAPSVVDLLGFVHDAHAAATEQPEETGTD